MQTGSYILSVSKGRGVYRHIQISAVSTFKDLHFAIAEAYGIIGIKGPAFTSLRQSPDQPPERYSTNTTKSTTAMRRVFLCDSPLAKDGRMIYSLASPRVSLNCRVIKTLEEKTESPVVLRSSGELDLLSSLLKRLIRNLKNDEKTKDLTRTVIEAINLTPELREKIFTYILAACNLYGVLSVTDLHALYCRYQPPVTLRLIVMHCVSLSKHADSRVFFLDGQGKALDKDAIDAPGEKYIVDYTVMDGEAFDYVRKNQGNKPMYIPSEDELLRYTDEDYVDENEHFVRMSRFLLSIGLEKTAVDDFMEDAVSIIRFDNNSDAIFDLLDTHQLRIKDRETANRLLKLFSDLSNNTRLPLNRGHTPNELLKLSGRKPPFEPSNITPFFPLAGQAGKKPGRNSPCPCGSGKKYKHCCGKTGMS